MYCSVVYKNFKYLNKENNFVSNFKNELEYNVDGFKINAIAIKKENYWDFINHNIVISFDELGEIKFPIKIMTYLDNPIPIDDMIVINFNWDYFFTKPLYKNYLTNVKDLKIRLDYTINYDVKLYLDMINLQPTKLVPDHTNYIKEISLFDKTELDISNSYLYNGFIVDTNMLKNIEITIQNTHPFNDQNKIIMDKFYFEKIKAKTHNNYTYLNLLEIIKGNLNYDLNGKFEKISESINIKFNFIDDKNNEIYIIKNNVLSCKACTTVLVFH